MNRARTKPSGTRPKTSAAHVGFTLLAISTVAIAMMSIGAFAVSYHFLHKQTLRHLNTLLTVTVAESVAPLQFRDAATAVEVLQAIPRQEGIVLAQMRDADGHVLAEMKDDGDSISQRLAHWIENEKLQQDVIVDDQRLGSITLEGGNGPLLRVLGSLLGWCLVVMLVVALTAFLLARRYTRQITQPIFELHGVVKRLLDDRDFSQRAPPSDLSEVEDLRSDFNSLLDEIAARDRMLQQSNAALTRVAYVDALTNLPNRAMFEQALLQIDKTPVALRERVCLLYLDIDGFKRVNDSFGHAIGDALLAEIGLRLRHWRAPNAIAARIGGDEFVVMISPCGGIDDAREASFELQKTLDLPIDTGDHMLYPAVSIGYAIYPDMADDTSGLLDIADRSMYDAKHLRNRQGRVTRWEAARRGRDTPPRLLQRDANGE